METNNRVVHLQLSLKKLLNSIVDMLPTQTQKQLEETYLVARAGYVK